MHLATQDAHLLNLIILTIPWTSLNVIKIHYLIPDEKIKMNFIMTGMAERNS